MSTRVLRPIEWAILAFAAFVLVRSGPQVFLNWNSGPVSGRAMTLLFSLGLVTALQLAWRFRQLPWGPLPPGPRRMLWIALPLALLPWLFITSVVLRSPMLREGFEGAAAGTLLSALVSMFMLTFGFGLPTMLGWLVAANELREHGRVRPGALREIVRAGASMARDWFPIVLILTGYEWMRAVVDAGFTGERDAVMAQIDRLMFFGADPLDLLEACIWKPLTELLAFVYSFYAVLFPLVLGTVLMTGGAKALRLSTFRVGLALLIAYVGYCLVPVKGPLFTRTFSVPLDMYLVGPIKEAMMDATRISYDCFPSMHTCCTLLLGYSAWTWARKLFWVISPIIVLMPLACLYLRYHYVIDVIVGGALAVFIVWLSKKLEPAITDGLPADAGRGSE